MKNLSTLLGIFAIIFVTACIEKNSSKETEEITAPKDSLVIDHTLTTENTHNKFSSSIAPVLKVESGAVIEAFTEEASDGQFNLNSTIGALDSLDFEPIHPLTGPVFVEDAKPGDVLKVTLHKIELGGWGWNAILPGFGFLADTIDTKYLKLYELGAEREEVQFNDDISIKLNPFPGVMGVAPDTSELLNTIPPRANGGNMDDPNMTEGTIMYFPVFVEGGLFSIGDGHAVQGLGEVCGTAIECPLRIVYEIELLKDKSIPEPQYETNDYYATTGFATTIDEAAKKATLYMVNYLKSEQGLSTEEAYALCSLQGDLQIAEVVDLPNMLVTMHMPKSVLN
ncbi:acetamidase/formamidase family protein [Croceivirga thetidis]|uniref:Acetamidase/formamidase family protein n=1 Tax=Croceivirga thetidis TaxID=2721623 RepID=A0ABX1GLY3_9FLAO|nr:acetamidase/formamidase family protein [Croceivirga thetidis]NKI30922.1 acetamidase/formamidase family protein [Croceivirga thetidis]